MTTSSTASTSSIPPGEWLGLLGGGQLGRMFAMAAHSLGYQVCVLDPDPHSPAGRVAEEHLHADYLDPQALQTMYERCHAVTTEFENVPAAALTQLADRCFVSPEASAVRVAQDRILEKRFVTAQGIAVAPHAIIQRIDDFTGLDQSLFPGILKSARLGYDGKGQVRVTDLDEARSAWDRMGRVPCVLEKRLALQQELSCIVCRGADGEVTSFPVAENEHRHGILAVSIAPARIDAALQERVRFAAARIVEALNYVGVLCVEFFVTIDGRLWVNELAPRPHNSGHYTIDACVTSQFEQQARILARLPLGDTRLLAPAVMLNLLGDLWLRHGQLQEPPWEEVLREPRAKLHLYGKRDARPGRKMGHLTLLGDSLADALARANVAARLLGLEEAK
jgi:5-(carboxyamino)imidazole ribonucleotide synthase